MIATSSPVPAAGGISRIAVCAFGLVLTALPLVAQEPQAKSAPPKGARIVYSGHSFHVFVPSILADIAKGAGIGDHATVGVSSIGGSYVHQHWAKEGEKSARAMIEGANPDVFTMAPIYLPDDGIENFVQLVATKSPQTLVTLQEFWLPFDVYDVNYKKSKPTTPDRDAMTAEYLRTEYGKYFAVMDEHVRELRKKYPDVKLVVVPVGQAVVALREKVIAGEAPGIGKQSELFTDPIGHCTAAIKVLNAYCHYAVVYRRSPVGLPVPAALQGAADEETLSKLNRLLQQLAWDAVTAHPLSGVTGGR